MVSKGCLKVSRGENNNKSVGMPITFTVARAYIKGAGVANMGWGLICYHWVFDPFSLWCCGSGGVVSHHVGNKVGYTACFSSDSGG